jgi:hypothetical protein
MAVRLWNPWGLPEEQNSTLCLLKKVPRSPADLLRVGRDENLAGEFLTTRFQASVSQGVELGASRIPGNRMELVLS